MSLSFTKQVWLPKPLLYHLSVSTLPLSLDLWRIFPSHNFSSKVSSSSLGSHEEIHKRRRSHEDEKKDKENKKDKTNEENTFSQDLSDAKKAREMDMNVSLG